MITYPDGGHGFYRPEDCPVVTVRFPDAGQVEFRTGSEWPRHARVQYRGLEVKGLRVDIDATVNPDGKVSAFSIWKTDVAGADGGCDIPVKVRESVGALCRKRAREARGALTATTRSGQVRKAAEDE